MNEVDLLYHRWVCRDLIPFQCVNSFFKDERKRHTPCLSSLRHTPSKHPRHTFVLSFLAAVQPVAVQPVTDLRELERSDAHGHVVIPVLPVDLQPLVSGEDPDDLPLPALQAVVPHPPVHPGAAGPGPRVAVLVDQVVGLLLHGAKPVDQLPGPVAVKP